MTTAKSYSVPPIGFSAFAGVGSAKNAILQRAFQSIERQADALEQPVRVTEHTCPERLDRREHDQHQRWSSAAEAAGRALFAAKPDIRFTFRASADAAERRAATEQTRLFPARKLKRSGSNQRRAGKRRNNAAESFPTHRRRRECDSERVNSHADRQPHGEVSSCDHRQRGRRPFLFQKCRQSGWQHHRDHHRQPHKLEAQGRLEPSPAGHSHPHHGHRPAAWHFHFATHRAAEMSRRDQTGGEGEGASCDEFDRRCRSVASG